MQNVVSTISNKMKLQLSFQVFINCNSHQHLKAAEKKSHMNYSQFLMDYMEDHFAKHCNIYTMTLFYQFSVHKLSISTSCGSSAVSLAEDSGNDF